jgi:hypothetical protein
LSGSIGLLFPLDFENTRVRVFLDRGMQVLYTTPIPGSTQEEEAVNLFIDNAGVSIAQDVPIDLMQHGTLTRFGIVTDSSGGKQEDRRTFPALASGSITFTRFTLTAEQTIGGHFEIIFTTGDTLLGDFKAKLEVGDPQDL